MLAYRSKHLSEVKNDFERGIFLVVYNSPKQRFHRLVVLLSICFKHIARGLLFSWPLYLIAFAAYSIPDGWWLMILLLLPGIYVSWVILNRGIKEDYEKSVKGYIFLFLASS